MTQSIAISVVVPAYNEESRLEPTLREVIRYLSERDEGFEVLVVDDGSSDETIAVARRVAREHPQIEVIALERNRGKGAAVRAGMLAAQGERMLFSDADLATPIAELPKLEAALTAGADVAIASRAAEGADIQVRQHPVRELMGRTFNVCVRLAGLGDLRDARAVRARHRGWLRLRCRGAHARPRPLPGRGGPGHLAPRRGVEGVAGLGRRAHVPRHRTYSGPDRPQPAASLAVEPAR
jgi:glycosyltransferase involved in cell wall biosynthesis